MSKFKQFLKKASGYIPELANSVGMLATGNILGAVKSVGDILKVESQKSEKAKELYSEFLLKEMEFEAEDRKDARSLYKVDSSLQKIFAITFLSLYIVLSFVILSGLYLISVQGLKLDNYVVSFVSTLHGGMSMKVGTIVDFLFGSSSDK